MNTQRIRKIRHRGSIIYLLIMIEVSGCASLFSPQAVEEAPAEDRILAMKIKAKLIEAKELKAAAIHVDASNGSVTLSGFVESESQRQLATSITQRTPDVKQVDNQIKVKTLD